MPKWVSDNFEASPPSTQVALRDFEGKHIQSVWFYCMHYRINVYIDGLSARIRDFHIYDEKYEGRYKNALCVTPNSQHDNLPIMNGLTWGAVEDRAGIYFCDEKGVKLQPTSVSYSEDENKKTAEIKINFGNRKATACFSEDAIQLQLSDGISLRFTAKQFGEDESLSLRDEKTLVGVKNGFIYTLTLTQGRIVERQVFPENGRISIVF